jgi:hypothetical protein
MPQLKTKNRSNLLSPTQLRTICALGSLGAWFRSELMTVSSETERQIVGLVYENLGDFVQWPQKSILLWEGRSRSEKYHSYPDTIKLMALSTGVRLDGRVNGPAVAAYRIAGGIRPRRLGSNNLWSVHHVYSGKFPYPGKSRTLHAAHDGKHCTQSAGLVAIHPIADQICDEYPFFAWLLRAISYERFGYDPDNVFSTGPFDDYGFVGKTCFVVPMMPDANTV